jgi:hypothetical protein
MIIADLRVPARINAAAGGGIVGLAKSKVPEIKAASAELREIIDYREACGCLRRRTDAD